MAHPPELSHNGYLAEVLHIMKALETAPTVTSREHYSFDRTVKEAARDYDLPPPELKKECPWIWAEMVAAYYNEAKGELHEALDRDFEVTGPKIINAFRDRDETEVGRIFCAAIYSYIERFVWAKYEEAREEYAIKRSEDQASEWSGERFEGIDP
jgi:hypothetical protein